MALHKITRIVYGPFGILYVLAVVGSMLLPTGWVPRDLAAPLMDGETSSPFIGHLLQEFGTVVLALGLAFVWFGSLGRSGRPHRLPATRYATPANG